MTKKLLLAATALTVIGFAGAASAQSISNVTISGQSRTLAAGAPGQVYRVAAETVSSGTSRSTSEATSVTATYAGSGLPTPAVAEDVRYRVAFTLSGAANPTFSASLTPLSLTIARAATTAGCTIGTPVIVAGGARGDSSVTYEFSQTAAAANNCDLDFITGVTLVHPFEVASLGAVSVAVSTSSVGSAPKTVPTNPTGFPGSVAIIATAPGYEFAAPAADALAHGTADQFVLAANAAGNRFASLSGDGIGNVGFQRVNYGTALVPAYAFAGLRGATLPTESYSVSLFARSGSFGTSTTTGFLGAIGSVADPVGAPLVATLVPAARAAANASQTTWNNRNGVVRLGIAPANAASTASLANRDQVFEAVVTPAVAAADASLVTLPEARTYRLETVKLQGTPILAPWMTSNVAGANTVLRIANNGTQNVGEVQLDLASALNATDTSARTCTVTEEPSLAGIAAGKELVINSALLTRCFGEFTRGDVHVRVLDTNSAGLTAKLRVVTAGGVVTEQSLGQSSGSGL